MNSLEWLCKCTLATLEVAAGFGSELSELCNDGRLCVRYKSIAVRASHPHNTMCTKDENYYFTLITIQVSKRL